MSNRERLRAKIRDMRSERNIGGSGFHKGKFSTICKIEAKDKGFRQQKEFGHKKRIKP